MQIDFGHVDAHVNGPGAPQGLGAAGFTGLG
jgi:hypothetical protein